MRKLFTSLLAFTALPAIAGYVTTQMLNSNQFTVSAGFPQIVSVTFTNGGGGTSTNNGAFATNSTYAKQATNAPDGNQIASLVEVANIVATSTNLAQTTPFTLVLIPDSQALSYTDAGSNLWQNTCHWIASSVTNLNIKAVLSMGDITENDYPSEYQTMRNGFDLLTNIIPVLPCAGNHDGPNVTHSRAYTNFNTYFSQNWITNQRGWYGGFYTPTNSVNSYLLLTNQGSTYVCLTTELGIGGDTNVVMWSSNICGAYPSAYAIFTTHCFLEMDGTRNNVNSIYAPAAYISGAFNGDQEWSFWNYIPNLTLIAGGHLLQTGNDQLPYEARRVDPGHSGNWINQLICNHQQQLNDSCLKILTFYPSQGIITAATVDFTATTTNYVAADYYVMPMRASGNINTGSQSTNGVFSNLAVTNNLVVSNSLTVYTTQDGQNSGDLVVSNKLVWIGRTSTVNADNTTFVIANRTAEYFTNPTNYTSGMLFYGLGSGDPTIGYTYIGSPFNWVSFGAGGGFSGGIERMRIISNGDIGIREIAPGSALSVYGEMSVGSDLAYSRALAPTNGMIIKGNVGIGTTQPTNSLSVNGSVDVANYLIVGGSIILRSNYAPAAIPGFVLPWNSNNVSQWSIKPGSTNFNFNY